MELIEFGYKVGISGTVITCVIANVPMRDVPRLLVKLQDIGCDPPPPFEIEERAAIQEEGGGSANVQHGADASNPGTLRASPDVRPPEPAQSAVSMRSQPQPQPQPDGALDLVALRKRTKLNEILVDVCAIENFARVEDLIARMLVLKPEVPLLSRIGDMNDRVRRLVEVTESLKSRFSNGAAV